MNHRLAAIFSADAAGYTRLLAEDEAETIRALGEARDQIAKSVALIPRLPTGRDWLVDNPRKAGPRE